MNDYILGRSLPNIYQLPNNFKKFPLTWKIHSFSCVLFDTWLEYVRSEAKASLNHHRRSWELEASVSSDDGRVQHSHVCWTSPLDKLQSSACDATPKTPKSQCLGPGLEKQKICNVTNQKVLPKFENVAKSQSNVAIEGHFPLLRVIQLLPKAEFHLNVTTNVVDETSRLAARHRQTCSSTLHMIT